MNLFRKTTIVLVSMTLLVAILGLTFSPLKNENGVVTGIYLDEHKNEVFLVIEDGSPAYYYSSIFTPVCETGECKPIYINLYWDIDGYYVKFDFPEGEILTKKDHVPFTAADYKLLDEILAGSDPRIGIAEVKHSEGSTSGEQNSSPAPAQPKVLLRMDMVDGVTGSTLPNFEDKFVPGALYTTYTIWDLANSHQLEMEEYTQQLVRSSNDED